MTLTPEEQKFAEIMGDGIAKRLKVYVERVVQEATQAERKLCEPWMGHKNNCPAKGYFKKVSEFDSKWVVGNESDCTCGLAARLEGK